jgi:5-methylthioadenosine/S-adenosylhomocysteine deaminase
MSILIKQVLLNDRRMDIHIRDSQFRQIAPSLDIPAETVIDGRPFALLPAFYNTHTHSPMTLLRSYADDIELHTWLKEYIWPIERKITKEHVYHGTRLAILEMIRSGTVYFNDMYWHSLNSARAAAEMGMRADIALLLIDAGDPGNADQILKNADAFFSHEAEYPDRIRFTYGPHAIYTVSEKMLRRCAERARSEGRRIHIHISETQTEVEQAIKNFGKRPVEYLDAIGFLGPDVTAVHGIHLNDNERSILRDRGVVIAHCPTSNMKLSSGHFDYTAMRENGIPLTLGTDGASSNNALSMLSEMKFAALWAKVCTADPTIAPAEEIFDMATFQGARAAGLKAGRIAEGLLADCMLVRLDHPTLIPSGHLISNMVYSASPECIDTVICNGRILMQNRIVPGEKDIIDSAENSFRQLISK